MKNINKNPVAEKAISKLEEELLHQVPSEISVPEFSLAVATLRLNSRIHFTGLSACELWTQRSQFTNEQILLSDREVIKTKHALRESNHSSSAFSRWRHGRLLQEQLLRVGDLLYLYCDRNKLKAQSCYIVVSVDGEWCYIKKFAGRQIWSNSYKIKKTECYCIPCDISSPKIISTSESCDEEQDENQQNNSVPIVMSPIIAKPPNRNHSPVEPTILIRTSHNPDITEDQPPCSSPTSSPTHDHPRYPVHKRHIPKHLQDYVLS